MRTERGRRLRNRRGRAPGIGRAMRCCVGGIIIYSLIACLLCVRRVRVTRGASPFTCFCGGLVSALRMKEGEEEYREEIEWGG